MATTAKKPPPPPVEEVKEAAPVAEPVAITPEPEPAPLIKGYTALSDDQVRRVNTIKEQFDDTIKYLETLRDSYHAAETQRALSVAITHAETASMWAVQAVTKVV